MRERKEDGGKMFSKMLIPTVLFNTGGRVLFSMSLMIYILLGNMIQMCPTILLSRRILKTSTNAEKNICFFIFLFFIKKKPRLFKYTIPASKVRN